MSPPPYDTEIDNRANDENLGRLRNSAAHNIDVV